MELIRRERSGILEEAALFRTPDEIREIYKSLGEVIFSAKALGIACHYRGLEHVKALGESCAAFFDIEFLRNNPDERRPDGSVFTPALLNYDRILDERLEFYEYKKLKKGSR